MKKVCSCCAKTFEQDERISALRNSTLCPKCIGPKQPGQAYLDYQAKRLGLKLVEFNTSKRSVFQCVKCGSHYTLKPTQVFEIDELECGCRIKPVKFVKVKIGKVEKKIRNNGALEIDYDDLDYHLQVIKAAGRAGSLSLVVRTGLRSIRLSPGWHKQTALAIHRSLEQLNGNQATVFSMDPGTNSFGWAVVRLSRSGKLTVERGGLIKRPIKSLKQDLISGLSDFEDELLAKCGLVPDAFAAERFMTRGMNGTTIEAINLMLGIVLSLAVRLGVNNVQYIPAAQWKNEFNKHYPLEDLYNETGTTPHECDAVLIGVYKACLLLGKQPYEIDLTGLAKKIKRACR